MLNKKIIAVCSFFITYQISHASESKEDREYLPMDQELISSNNGDYPELAQGFALLGLNFDAFKITTRKK